MNLDENLKYLFSSKRKTITIPTSNSGSKLLKTSDSELTIGLQCPFSIVLCFSGELHCYNHFSFFHNYLHSLLSV